MNNLAVNLYSVLFFSPLVFRVAFLFFAEDLFGRKRKHRPKVTTYANQISAFIVSFFIISCANKNFKNYDEARQNSSGVQFFARPLARPLCTSTGLTLKVDVQKTGPFLFTSSFTSNEEKAVFLHVHSSLKVDVQRASPVTCGKS